MKDVAGRGTEVYGYNLQGWQESIAAYFYGYDVFSQTMNYQIPYMDTSEPRYDGMISEVRHRHLNKDIQTVNYKYDGVRRLVDSEHFVNWDSTACNLWTESSIVYDLNGNIENLSRKRESDDEDIIAVTHSGNRMTGSIINGGTTNTYSYYSDGNLKQDNRRNLQFVYNLLNLPSVVTDASGQTVKVRYSYLADGTKLSVRDAQNDGLSYRGSFVYTVDGTAGSTGVTEKLESIAHDEGRFVALSASAGATTTQFIDTWHIRDHLGSVRTVLDITRDTSEVSDPTLAILEQNDYLPFGTRIDLDSLAYDQSNRYRFNGKEEQVTGSLGLTDYGARFYDCILPRWTTPDPLAEKYYGISPYAFCNNNPVNFVDPDGRQIQFFEMAAYSGSIPNYAYSMPIYDYETGDYSITGYYNEEGNLVGYGAARNGRLEYVMDNVDDIDRFVNNIGTYSLAYDFFNLNGGPSNGVLDILTGSLSRGLFKMWGDALKDPVYYLYAASALGTALLIAPNYNNVYFGQNPNQTYHAFRHIDELGLSRTQVKMAVLDDIKYIHTTIKPRTSINRVLRVNGKNLQYTVFRLGDNNLNVGRIHEK